MYSEYVDWLEERLSEFCKAKGCTQEDIFEKLKECMESEKSVFMPMFMQNTEYKFFLDQMRHFANGRKTKKIAEAAARDSEMSVVNFSGHWSVDQSFDHKKSCTEYLEVRYFA